MDYYNQFIDQLMECGNGKKLIAMLFGFLASVLDGAWTLIATLMALYFIDLALGLRRAWKEHNIDGARIGQSVNKVVLYFIAIQVMAFMDSALSQVITFVHAPVRNGFITYLCLIEGLSCIRHLRFLGMRIPMWLESRLSGYLTAMDQGPASSKGGVTK